MHVPKIAIICLVLAGCPDGAAPGSEDLHLVVRFEGVSATAAHAACQRLGGFVSDDVAAVLAYSDGRSMWLGYEPNSGLCERISDAGEITRQSCYPQPDPTVYPGGYVCAVPHTGATISTPTWHP